MIMSAPAAVVCLEASEAIKGLTQKVAKVKAYRFGEI